MLFAQDVSRLILSCYYLHASLETFILRVGFISFDVGQIIVDNGDIAQTFILRDGFISFDVGQIIVDDGDIVDNILYNTRAFSYSQSRR